MKYAVRAMILAGLMIWPPGAVVAFDEEGRAPEDMMLRAEYGIAMALSGDARIAERVFVSLLSDSPGNAMALTNLGNLHLMRGQAAVALVFYERAGQADSTDAGIILNRSLTRMLMGDERGAREDASVALDLAGSAREALSLLGLCRRGLPGEEDKARDAPVLSEEEVRALLEAAASSVPIDSLTAAGADTAGSSVDSSATDPSHRKAPSRIWRSAGLRAADQRDLATTLYWKR